MSFRGFHSPGLAFGLALMLVLTLAPAAHAQLLQGTIEGSVTDSTQAAIVGAEVTILHDATNRSRVTTTSQFGAYNFQTVDTGTYTLTVTSEGFQTYVQTGVNITQNSVTRVNLALQIGQITETVTVEASAATL